MSTGTHAPTDVLLAVAELKRVGLPAVENQADALAAIEALLDEPALRAALDPLIGALHQYPWQACTDRPEVIRTTPVGTVRIDDIHAASTARGLLFALATGNDVVIRTDRPRLWLSIAGAFTATELPLPAIQVTDRVDDGLPSLSIPDLELVGARAIFEADSLAAWTHGLVHRERIPGLSLAQARSSQPEQLSARLRYLVHRARECAYYTDLPDIKGIEEISTLPVMDKDALAAATLPEGRALYSGAPASGEVLRSGGSSGAPRYVVSSLEDWENMVREAVPLLFDLGLRPGTRLINTLFGGGLYGGLTTSVCELSRMPVQCYTTGQIVTVDDLLMLTDDRFEADAILGQPALILPLLREAKARRPELSVEKILYGGTPMSESDKVWLREELGATTIASVLAANDGAQLGYQCAHLSGTRHHLIEDFNHIEVVDDENRPVESGHEGHLLVTSLQKFEAPLLRYRIGDYGRITEGHACACGVTGPILEYLGRSDGLIKMMGRRVLHGELVDALSGYGVSRLQVEIASDGRKETVTLHTEAPTELDADVLRKHLLEEFAVLGDDSRFDPQLGVFELEVICHADGSLPRDPVSGKIKPVIDRRLR